MILRDTNISRLILEQIQTEKTAEKKPAGKVCVEDARRISKGLFKVAGLPYKEKVFHSVQEMMKIASKYMEDLVISLESVRKRNSDLEKVAEVRAIMDDMLKIGQVDQYSVEEKVAELMKKDQKELEIIKEAMKMIENGKDGNVFFELEKEASASGGKKGMFDNLLPG
jgi:hypothetical protein